MPPNSASQRWKPSSASGWYFREPGPVSLGYLPKHSERVSSLVLLWESCSLNSTSPGIFKVTEGRNEVSAAPETAGEDF